MKHTAFHFEKMSPVELMGYLSEKHYPIVVNLLEGTEIHLSTAVKTNEIVYPFLPEMEKEFRKLSTLTRRQINKNTRILFPFIDNALEQGKNNCNDLYSVLEIETEELHTQHIKMRTSLANMAALSYGFKPGMGSSETMKVAFSELHTFEQQLYRQFYVEDVLLVPKVKQQLFGSTSLNLAE
jgi:iron-sulfur cluster repair protein YtfE (RIC family)